MNRPFLQNESVKAGLNLIALTKIQYRICAPINFGPDQLDLLKIY